MSIVLLYLALLPSLLIIIFVWRLDKVEKEPESVLLKAFVFGVLSVIPVIILEELVYIPINRLFPEGSAGFIILENFLGVALIEEWGKRGAAKLAVWKNPAFNYRFDAILYCVLSALGFATLENILYVFENGVGTAILRALLSVPSHAIDGIMMGYFFGLAKMAELDGDKAGKRKYYLLSLIVPTIAHGLYDAALSTESDWILIAFFIMVIAVDIWAFRFIRKQSREDKPL